MFGEFTLWTILLGSMMLNVVQVITLVHEQHARAQEDHKAMVVEHILAPPGRFVHEWANDEITTIVVIKGGYKDALRLLFGWHMRVHLVTETEVSQEQIADTETVLTWLRPKWWPQRKQPGAGMTAPE